jgi:hypothetical protein
MCYVLHDTLPLHHGEMISIVHHITTNRRGDTLCPRMSQQHNLPESQEWETIHLNNTVQVYSHWRRMTTAPNPLGWQEWQEATQQARGNVADTSDA